MSDCCQSKQCEVAALRQRHSRVLWVVLSINASMFLVEAIAGLAAHSTSLLADALDMLGDAWVYAASLMALSRSLRWQAGAALAKGAFMLLFGIGVLMEASFNALHALIMPVTGIMGVVGGIALTANLGCFALLYRHRDDNLNLRSTWLCARNDVIANIGVLVAAVGSALLASRWPDIVIGVFIAGLFLRTALGVLGDSMHAWRAANVPDARKA